MPSVKRYETKDGRRYYLIRVRRGREKSTLSRRWYVPDGWSQRAIDRELTKVAAEFERAVHDGEIVSRAEQRQKAAQEAAEAAQVPTLRKYAERVFMPAITIECTENTRASYQGNLDRWVLPDLGDIKLPEITTAQISALLLDMQAKGKAISTVIKVYTILKSLFKMAYLSDTIPKNPMDKVQRPSSHKAVQEKEAYTAEELREIMGALDGEPLKWRCFVHLLIDTGVRRGEALGLQWQDIDFEGKTALIKRNLCYTPEKGVYLDTPKNGKSRRVYLGDDTLKLLQQLRGERVPGAEFVFTQEDSTEPMNPTSPTHYFRQFGKKYGIKGFHPHKLRHTFASVAITAGADVVSVSEALGHSDTAVTLRMYTHANLESRHRASQIFWNAIKDTQKNTPTLSQAGQMPSDGDENRQ